MRTTPTGDTIQVHCAATIRSTCKKKLRRSAASFFGSPAFELVGFNPTTWYA
jgi:hypothetical protein